MCRLVFRGVRLQELLANAKSSPEAVNVSGHVFLLLIYSPPFFVLALGAVRRNYDASCHATPHHLCRRLHTDG